MLVAVLGLIVAAGDPSRALDEATVIPPGPPPVVAPPRRPRIRSGKRASAAAALSALFPGLGHLYLGDFVTGRSFVVLGVAQLSLVGATLAADWHSTRDINANPFVEPGPMLALTLCQNTWTYSIFAAYRDARALSDNRGYRLPIPKGDLRELIAAPFNPEVLLQPEVAVGLIGMVALGLVVSHLTDESLRPRGPTLFERRQVRFMGQERDAGRAAVLGELYYLGLFTPVGIGEEALFRGFFQSTLSESLGPWAGWATASLLFGVAHVPNVLVLEDPGLQERYLGFGVPVITALGAYLGWVYLSNDYSLAEPVALHFWYDFILSAISFALNPDRQPFAVQVSVPF